LAKHIKSYPILVIAFASLLLFGLSDNIRGPLFPEILYTFAVSDSQGSWFFSFSSGAGILGSFVCAWLISKRGEKQTLEISLFLLIAAQLLVSFSPTFQSVLASKILFGFSLGLMGVIQNFLVVQASPEKYKKRILAGLHSMYAGASLLAPLLVNALVIVWKNLHGETELWRAAFRATAFFSFLLLLVTLRQKKWIIPNSKQALDNREMSNESQFKRIYFSLILASYVAAEILISSRIALYLRREHAATLEESSFYTAGFFLCLLAGRSLFSFWSPNLSTRRQLILSLASSLVLILLGLFWHPLFLAVSGLAMAPFYPLMMGWAGEIFSKNLAASLGLAMTLSNIAVLGMHLFLGMVSSWPGIRYGFMLGPLLCLIALGMLISYEKFFHQLQPEIRR
jgi:fucose permease